MMSLHEVFEVVGSQLTEDEIVSLSFLLNELYPGTHPLDPAGWTVQPHKEDSQGGPASPGPGLLKAWRRLRHRDPRPPLVAPFKPKSGLELLLELERRGHLSDGNLEPLLQLLRVLTRQDLLPLVSNKKQRTVSPERTGGRSAPDSRGRQCVNAGTQLPLPFYTQQLSRSIHVPEPHVRRRRRKRGHGWSRRPKRSRRRNPPLPPAPTKKFCNVRLRVRAEYQEHESALRDGVSSDKQQPLERQFQLFERSSSVLRSRDLGSVVCEIKFTELQNLEAFWDDYLSGVLLEALKGVFITDSLRRAAGREGVRLLISVDQDDYEKGLRLLRGSPPCGGVGPTPDLRAP